MLNHVAAIYEPFTLDEISAKVAELSVRKHIMARLEAWASSISRWMVPRSHARVHTGDWYFHGPLPHHGAATGC
jgi:hypothetical protein